MLAFNAKNMILTPLEIVMVKRNEQCSQIRTRLREIGSKFKEIEVIIRPGVSRSSIKANQIVAFNRHSVYCIHKLSGSEMLCHFHDKCNTMDTIRGPLFAVYADAAGSEIDLLMIDSTKWYERRNVFLNNSDFNFIFDGT